MADSTEPGKVSEGPAIKRETWFALALASMIMTVLAGAVAAMWVFSADEPALMVQRAQAFTPFGAALLAIVTFCTVAWRGVLNTEQLERQADQLQQQIRQNDAKDEENLAKLLLDGTKLLDAEEEAHVLAGIAVLQAVATAQNPRFAIEAMNILLGVAERTIFTKPPSTIFLSANDALASGVKMKRRGNKSIELFAPDESFDWTIIEGASVIKLSGGTYSGDFFDREEETRFKRNNVVFDKTNIEFLSYNNDASFKNCRFYACHIIRTSVSKIMMNRYIKCDFSDAEIYNNVRNKEYIDLNIIRKNIQGGENFYREDRPPVSPDWFDVVSMLEVH